MQEANKTMKKEKIIGILGGMGPYTTVDIFHRIIELTPAKRDWEHLRIIIDNNPKIPSRSRAVLFSENSPVPMMMETAKNLERAGADFIIIPCNTSHYFYSDVQKSVNIPILNIIEETTKYVIEKMPKLKKIGLLSTLVTVKGKLYHKTFNEKGVEVIVPNENDQTKVNEVIEAVKIGKKGNETELKIIDVANKLIDTGAECIVIGCTEISIVLKDGDLSAPVFDSNQILAEKSVKIALEGK